MKKLTICFLAGSRSIEGLKTNPFKDLLINLSKKTGKIFLISIDHLVCNSKIRKYNSIKLFHGSLPVFSPKSYKELGDFFNNKNIIIINNIDRTFQYYRLLFFLRVKKIPMLAISNLGNKQ
jgi:hypothetical protein